jgi:hypothetical protein
MTGCQLQFCEEICIRVPYFDRSRPALGYLSLIVRIVQTFQEWLDKNSDTVNLDLRPSRSIFILDSIVFQEYTRIKRFEIAWMISNVDI